MAPQAAVNQSVEDARRVVGKIARRDRCFWMDILRTRDREVFDVFRHCGMLGELLRKYGFLGLQVGSRSCNRDSTTLGRQAGRRQEAVGTHTS